MKGAGISITAGLLASSLFLLPACQGPPPLLSGVVAEEACSDPGRVTHSVFLIGDAGDVLVRGADDPPGTFPDPVLKSLSHHVQLAVAELGVEQVAVVYLGDNVYPKGLYPVGHSDRKRGEAILMAQIEAAAPARAIFTAGNHDWQREGGEGWQNVTAQAEFLSGLGPDVAMLPPGGCAGPVTVDFGRHLRFVFIDVIGYVHMIEHGEQHKGRCPYSELSLAVGALADEFETRHGRHVVLALHHPLLSAGPHGGHFTLRQHLFPFTDFVSWLWLPLPVIGSIYPISRQLGVTGTDTTSSLYMAYVRGIYRASTSWSPLLIAAGHEHSLQVHRDRLGLYYLVSGAGSVSKVDRVHEMDTLMMAAARPGFMQLDAFEGGSLDVTVHALDDAFIWDDILGLDGEPTERIFHHCVATGPQKGQRP